MKFIKHQHLPKDVIKKEKVHRRHKIDAKEHHKAHMTENEHPKYPPKHSVEGTIRVTPKGVGYVAVEGMTEDLEIAPADLGTALDLDRVKVIQLGKVQGRRQGAEVTEILFRNKTKFVGVLDREGGSYFLEPDDVRMYRRILIPEQHLNGAKNGEKVYVEMTTWTEAKKGPIGAVLKILGKPDTHNVEMESIVLERGFMTTFDPDVLDAAEQIPLEIPKEEIAKRRDFRNVLTLTIDPKDAKDYDDALSWKKLPDGNVEVGVHIADVSHYVTPGSRIDKEGLERGTSIYLVDRTGPRCGARPLATRGRARAR
jgi:VacB/RNase II family 3'-5' exoribonuclease